MSNFEEAVLSLSREERLQEGIFFTRPGLVEEIVCHFDYTDIKHVLDSAAGSGNFLIPLAKANPQIEFYGIERNPAIYKETLGKVKNIGNIHYFQGDCLLEEFPIPPCDLYLGNPPFVNHSDLLPEYREQIQPLWYRYLDIPRDFSLLLGKSRADIAQLIFQVTVERYLKPQGQIGVVLPDSLLWGKSAAMGFQKSRGFSILKLVEIPEDNAFEGTRRSSFYVIGRKGEKTSYPIYYQNREGEEGRVELRQGHWQLSQKEQKTWPDEWFGFYRARQGINTLGANRVFFFQEKPDLEEELIFPLLTSSDINPWEASPKKWCLLPYRKGRLIPAEILEKKYPRAWKYLHSCRDFLRARKSRFAQKNWYGLFGIGPYTFAPYRVTWRALGAKKMQAAVVTQGIPNQAMHGYIPLENAAEAFYVTALMNNSLFQEEILQMCRCGSKSFGQPGIISRMPLPPFQEGNPQQGEIAEISESLHRVGDPEKADQLDKLVRKWFLSSLAE